MKPNFKKTTIIIKAQPLSQAQPKCNYAYSESDEDSDNKNDDDSDNSTNSDESCDVHCMTCGNHINVGALHHRTISMDFPFCGGAKVNIDENIAPLIQELWNLEILTLNSCEDNNNTGQMWIQLASQDDLQFIMDMLFKGRKRTDKLFIASQKWSYTTHISNENVDNSDDEDDEDDEDDDKNISPLFQRLVPECSLSWRFPIDDYDEIYERLKKCDGLFDAEEDDQYTINRFVEAALDNELDEIKIIIRECRNLDIDACHDDLFMNALMVASHAENVNVVKYLLNRDANVNATNIDGENALMIVCQDEELDHKQTIRLLLDKKSNLKMRNNDGQTVIDLAKLNKNSAVLKYLTEPDIEKIDKIVKADKLKKVRKAKKF